MSEEGKNVFERRQPRSTLADDQKHRFTRHQEVVDTQRRDTSAHDQREQARESQRAAWTGLSATPTTASGVRLDPATAGLKAASDADREKRRNAQPVVIPPISTIIAVIEAWQRQQAHFFESNFNYASLTNYIVTGIAEGWLTLSVEAVADAYVRLLRNGQVETAPGERYDPQRDAIVKELTGMSRSAPTIYPKYVWPAEEAAAREAEVAQALAEHEAGRQAAASRPFHELQDEVRKGFKPPKPGDPNL